MLRPGVDGQWDTSKDFFGILLLSSLMFAVENLGNLEMNPWDEEQAGYLPKEDNKLPDLDYGKKKRFVRVPSSLSTF